VGKNLGFGAAHNRAVSRLGLDSEFHLFLNPDVEFDPNVVEALLSFMRDSPDVGAVMPRVTYPDGRPQYLCKLLPTPLDLILRRFIPLTLLRNELNRDYELQTLSLDRTSDVPVLSGCFLLVRTSILKQIGGFDPRFFMYMEDVDLVRRIGDVSRTVFFPMVTVRHVYAKGSYRSPRLLAYHLKSAIAYFFKWGWFFDKTRRNRNRSVIRAAL
jgi:GT2 family glycosyltransferase